LIASSYSLIDYTNFPYLKSKFPFSLNYSDLGISIKAYAYLIWIIFLTSLINYLIL